MTDFSDHPAWVSYQKAHTVTRVVRRICAKRVYKYSKVVRKYRCVKTGLVAPVKKCVKYELMIMKPRSRLVCKDRKKIVGLRYCSKWNKSSICKKHVIAYPKLKCIHKKRVGRRYVCDVKKIVKPTVFCKHYDIVNNKRLCRKTSVYFGHHSGKLVC